MSVFGGISIVRNQISLMGLSSERRLVPAFAPGKSPQQHALYKQKIICAVTPLIFNLSEIAYFILRR
jgi:hypothetical protein